MTSTVPPLQNDCFALPPGVHWTPVREALCLLQERLSPVTANTVLPVPEAAGRILASDAQAQRAHPPVANSAVDGYAVLAKAFKAGPQHAPLDAGRSAAGAAFAGLVPAGHALRTLTGAPMPAGTDSVILQEDVAIENDHIAFHAPIKPGANARKAGEDVQKDQTLLRAGRVLTPADIGLLSATGVSEVTVRQRLRVAVLSTGDELRDAQEDLRDDQIYDANRPMLLALLRQFGYEPVDLGRSPDNRDTLREILDEAAQKADVILTSGGASAGDEDHISALLNDTGSMALWRIALKPGRPLALGVWQGKPVFGLPGNPVAAFVCTLIFARPAMRHMAGEDWHIPQGVMLPAGFEKTKKNGRREYLRARLRNGQVEVFASEGSGRISGLSWAEGLVELTEEAQDITHGDLVRFIPFSDF